MWFDHQQEDQADNELNEKIKDYYRGGMEVNED